MTTVFQGKIVVGDGDLIASIDNQSYLVDVGHPAYKKLFEAFRDNNADAFLQAFNVTQCLESYVSETSGCGLVVDGDRIYFDGIELVNTVVDTIRNMMRLGLDFDPMVRFLERAIKSNSKRVVDELFKFLQACQCTITEDGCFLAYKSVRSDYFDKYTGSVLNTIGAEIRMKKWLVDDDCNKHCSHGYHVGALNYAGPGGWYNNPGDKVMIVKVAPEDVVSVPTDHSCQKLRTCAYTVVGEFKGELQSTVYSGKIGDDYSQPSVPKREPIALEPEDMLVDGMYGAVYTNKQGVHRARYFIVLEKYSTHVLVELLDPEENAGSVRRFNLNTLSDVRHYDPDDEDDDYDCDDEDSECDDDDDCCCDDNMNVYW